MSTTIVETWSGTDLTQLGPIYPMVGTEVILVAVGVAFWLGFHVLQAGIERRQLREDEEAARSPERLKRVFRDEAKE
jgi:hypothetical protein